MKDGLVIIDVDGHVQDQESIYRERLPEEFRHRSAVYPSDGFDRAQNGAMRPNGIIPWAYRPGTAKQNLADNDRQGIDVQVCYPTGGLFLSRVRDREFSIALARTYNDWLHDWCSIDPKRLKGVAIVPLHVDVTESI